MSRKSLGRETGGHSRPKPRENTLNVEHVFTRAGERHPGFCLKAPKGSLTQSRKARKKKKYKKVLTLISAFPGVLCVFSDPALAGERA